ENVSQKTKNVSPRTDVAEEKETKREEEVSSIVKEGREEKKGTESEGGRRGKREQIMHMGKQLRKD
ncbi:hypothetical protein ACMWOO_12960, partial [Staphylococcus ureilyticus]